MLVRGCFGPRCACGGRREDGLLGLITGVVLLGVGLALGFGGKRTFWKGLASCRKQEAVL